MWLNRYTTGGFSPGRSFLVQLLWYFLGSPLVESRWLPFSRVKVALLRLFGARIGKHAVIKPGVRIKFPWRLTIEDSAWIGQDVWVDNLAHVAIGQHSCISQNCYLCTGNHDWSSPNFELRPQSISIGKHVWLAARSTIGPGSVVADGTVLGLGSTFTGRSDPWSVYQGAPAVWLKKRPQTDSRDRKDILLINQNFYPDESATSQYLTDLALELVKSGHRVTVLASRFGYLKPTVNYPRYELWRDIHIHRVGFLPSYRKTFFSRLLSTLSLNISFALRLRSMPAFDSVVVMTSPPLIAWIALIFLKRPKPRLLYWLMDINPDQSIAAGYLKRESFVAKILARCFRFVLSRSSRVVVLDHFMKERLLTQGVDERKIEEISLWANTDELKPVKRNQNPFIEEHGLENKFVVMYSGNFSLCHPLTCVLHAAEKLRSDPSTQFVFIGDGVQAESLKEEAAERRLSNVIFLPYQERSHLSEALSGADIHIVSLGEEYVGIVHPSKIYGILAVGKPTLYIGPAESSVSECMQDFGVTVQPSAHEVDAIYQAIVDYKQRPLDERQVFEKRIREAALQTDRARVIPRLIQNITEG